MAEQDDFNEQQPTREGFAEAEPRALREQAAGFVRQLFDLQMREIITTRMLPVIYGLAVAFAALSALYSIGWAFSQSWWLGAVWAVIVGPAVFIGIVTTIRVLLEFILTVFRIACYMEVLGNQIEGISDRMEGIDADLPRIQFWRSWKRDK